MKKSFYIENLGCAKNQVDAECLINILEKAGYRYITTPARAAFILVNTCGFIQEAKQESIDTILQLKLKYPDKKVIMTGCLSQRYAKELRDELREIDGFLGNRNLSQIVALLQSISNGKRPIFLEERPEKQLYKRKHILSARGSVYVKISEGCNNNCTYCAIPIIRGALWSRDKNEIIREITAFTAKGVKEVILIAQDLASYGREQGKSGLVELLKDILSLNGGFWLRMLYIHPDHFPHEILSLVNNNPRLLAYFDIPFQHANYDILKAMGRCGNKQKYLSLIKQIRDNLDSPVIRTTFLVGFPGEREEHFADLLDFQQKAQLNWAGIFIYSPEEGTKAYTHRCRVKKSIALARKQRLQEEQQKITTKWLDTFRGKSLDVLIEEEVKSSNLYLGRAFIQAPDVDGLMVVHADHARPGQKIKVKVINRSGIDLEAVKE